LASLPKNCRGDKLELSLDKEGWRKAPGVV
jgi:hypothetical protein